MTTIRTNADAVADELRRKAAAVPAVVDLVLEHQASSIAAELARVSPVDTGRLAASWRADGSTVVNDAPYASYQDIPFDAARAADEAATAVDAALQRHWS